MVLVDKHRETEEAYKLCTELYCEDSKQSSEEFGKKMLGCILFICKSQETLYQVMEARRKEEERMAKKTNLTFK